IQGGADALLLDWAVDSDFRFFPIEKDPQFGYRLHPVDIATNKLLAAVGREEPRDIVDVMQLHHRLIPLGAMAWAAAGKDPGLTPKFILEELKRASRYQQSDLDGLNMKIPISVKDLSLFLRSAGRQAKDWISRMPPEEVGRVYIDARSKFVQHNPKRPDEVTAHAGSRGGHWPSNSTLLSLMLQQQIGEDEERGER
ncbi:MAG: hypothetical protein ACREEN_07485, partial [Stellaceae bacterium]